MVITNAGPEGSSAVSSTRRGYTADDDGHHHHQGSLVGEASATDALFKKSLKMEALQSLVELSLADFTVNDGKAWLQDMLQCFDCDKHPALGGRKEMEAFLTKKLEQLSSHDSTRPSSSSSSVSRLQQCSIYHWWKTMAHISTCPLASVVIDSCLCHCCSLILVSATAVPSDVDESQDKPA